MSKDKELDLDIDIDSIFGDYLAGDKNTIVDEIGINFEDDKEDELEEEEDKTPAKEPKGKAKSKDPIEEEVEEEEELEDDEEEDKDTEGDADELEEEEDVEYSYKAIVNYLSEEGILDFEDSEDIEDNPDVIKDAVLNTARNMVEEYKESIPEDGKKFLDYLEKGGDPSKYFQILEKPLDFGNLKLEDEGTQKRVVSEFLKEQGFTEDEIEETIQDYEDGLILEKQAKIASKRLEKIYEKQKESLIKEQEKELEARRKKAEEYVSEIKNTINSSSDLGGLTVSNADKKQFEKYLLSRDKDGLTQYERELKENPVKTQLELAYLKFKKFNFSKVANKVKTEEARRIKGLVKSKDTTPKGNSKRVERQTKADLSGFASLF